MFWMRRRNSSLVITDGVEVELLEGGQYTGVTYNRILAAGKYGTIILPFAPDAATLNNNSFYELAGNTSESITFAKVEQPEAGKPYLYKLAPTGTEGAAITAERVALATRLCQQRLGS